MILKLRSKIENLSSKLLLDPKIWDLAVRIFAKINYFSISGAKLTIFSIRGQKIFLFVRNKFRRGSKGFFFVNP